MRRRRTPRPFRVITRWQHPSQLAFAPANFPAGFNNGIFLGFDGKGGVTGPTNEENAVGYYDFPTGKYIHFSENSQNGVYEPIGILTTPTQLMISDFGAGIVYEVTGANTLPPPVVSTDTVSPQDGSGSGQVFTFQFSDSNGYADLLSGRYHVLVNSAVNGVGSCWVLLQSTVSLAPDDPNQNWSVVPYRFIHHRAKQPVRGERRGNQHLPDRETFSLSCL